MLCGSSSILWLLAGLRNIFCEDDEEAPSVLKRWPKASPNRETALKKLRKRINEEHFTIREHDIWCELGGGKVKDEYIFIEGPLNDGDLKGLTGFLILNGSCVTNQGLRKIVEDWYNGKRWNMDIRITKNFEILDVDVIMNNDFPDAHLIASEKLVTPETHLDFNLSFTRSLGDDVRFLILEAFNGGMRLRSGVRTQFLDDHFVFPECIELERTLETLRVLVAPLMY